MDATSKTQSLMPDDVLSALLVLAKRGRGTERLTLHAHDYELQRMFKNLASTHPLIAESFVFSNSGPEPYSPVLNESISRLQLAGLVGRENPSYEVLFLQPAAEQYYDKFIASRLKPDTKKELESAAEALSTSLGAAA